MITKPGRRAKKGGQLSDEELVIPNPLLRGPLSGAEGRFWCILNFFKV
jgi:hypothetical protein